MTQICSPVARSSCLGLREGRKPAVAGTSFCQRNRDLQGGGEGSNPAGQAEKTVTEPTDT